MQRRLLIGLFLLRVISTAWDYNGDIYKLVSPDTLCMLNRVAISDKIDIVFV